MSLKERWLAKKICTFFAVLLTEVSFQALVSHHNHTVQASAHAVRVIAAQLYVSFRSKHTVVYLFICIAGKCKTPS